MREYLFKVIFEDGSVDYIPIKADNVREARRIFRRQHSSPKTGDLAGFRWCLLRVYGEIGV